MLVKKVSIRKKEIKKRQVSLNKGDQVIVQMDSNKDLLIKITEINGDCGIEYCYVDDKEPKFDTLKGNILIIGGTLDLLFGGRIGIITNIKIIRKVLHEKAF